MAAPNYTVLNLDLTQVRTAERVLENGVAYDSVTVLAVPAGAGASVAFGSSKPFVPVLTQGQTFDICVPTGPGGAADEGLFISNPAGGGILSLFISFGGAGVTT